MKYIFALLSLVVFSNGSNALRSLEESSISRFNDYAVAVANTVSAFYMYGLTDKDPIYKERVMHYKNLSDRAARLLMANREFKSVVSKWEDISEIIIRQSLGQQGHLDFQSNLLIREYVTSLYLHSNREREQDSLAGKINYISRNIAFMSARVFDLVGTGYNGQHVNDFDRQLNLEMLDSNINTFLEYAIEHSAPHEKLKYQRLLNKYFIVSRNFMNHREQFLYFITYKNYLSIFNNLYQETTKQSYIAAD